MSSFCFANIVLYLLFLLILPILNFLDLASFDPLLDVPVGGGGRDAESGGEFLICLAVKGFRESVEESLLACVCRCGGYGFFDLREGAENLVDVDYEDITDSQGCTEVRLRTGQGRGEVTGFEDAQGGENQNYPEGG